MSDHVAHPKFIFHILEKRFQGFLLKYQYIFKKGRVENMFMFISSSKEKNITVYQKS